MLTKTLVLIGLLISTPALAESEVVYQTICMEASNQDAFGQMLVAKVIQNRSRAKGISPEAVCLAKYQFSAWNDKKWAKSWLLRHYTTQARAKAVQAWNDALRADKWHKLTHYCTVDTKPYWAVSHKGFRAGSHIFYENIK